MCVCALGTGLTVAPQGGYQVGAPEPVGGGYARYDEHQDVPGGMDNTGSYETKDGYSNYIDSPHYPTGPSHPRPHMPGSTSSASPYHGPTGRGRIGTAHQVLLAWLKGLS